MLPSPPSLLSSPSVPLPPISSVKLWPTIKKSKELHTNLGAKPNSVEILVGLACWFTFAVQTSYKLYTGRGTYLHNRGIFMNNPCHIVLLMQGFLLLTKKTSFSAVVFIFSLRWLYGVYLVSRFLILLRRSSSQSPLAWSSPLRSPSFG